MTTNEREQIEQAITHIEGQRGQLGDAAADAAIAGLRQQLAALEQPGPEARGMEGERRLVTVTFIDVSGFTAMAERMDPEQARDLMNGCFERLVPVINRYGGAVCRFLGDAIMALFGAPVAHEDDPERALRAALEIMDELAAFNAERGTDLGVHVGVNTGLAIAGGLGTSDQHEYSVMGDAVNLAARLEDASQRGEIFVGPDTYRLTEPLFAFDPLPPIRLKGKAEPVPVYRLLAARAVPGKMRGIPGLASPLVGREAELSALREAIERMRSSAGGVVTLVGEAGLGKSRLVAELRKQAGETADLRWVEGRCLSYGGPIAYLLWLDVLRGLLDVDVEAAPAVVRERLQEKVQALCPDRFDDVTPYLAHLLAPDGDARLRDLEGEQVKAGTFHAFEVLIESAAWEHPLVLVCEDLHWADPTSLELLERLLALTDRAPLLPVCVFRPEREHNCWRIKEVAARSYAHRHVDLWLDPLSDGESRALMGNLLRVEHLPRKLRKRILDHAEGNPFYVEEIVRSLIDDGVVVRDEATGRWRATRDVADVAIPDTLHGVLMARIDRLQEETRRVLQLASVVGRIFFYRVLAAIASEERRLDEHLVSLQREEMIRERARVPELEYIFKHHLTQQAAYNGLLKKERRVFHRQVAEALERLFPDRVEEQVGLLAHHWERAEEPEKAAAYLLRAGDRARIAYAHEEAIDCYRRALPFLEEQEEYEQAARTLIKLGLVYHNRRDFRQARRAYDEGSALWQRAAETPHAAPPPAPHPLRLCFAEPSTLDPPRSADGASSYVIHKLMSGLVETGPETGVVPDVAQRWEVLEDGRRYVFHLRRDVRWSDGFPVTAGDFECAWKRALSPALGLHTAGLLYDVEGARAYHRGEVSDPDSVGVRALDEATLEVELENPVGYFLHLLVCVTAYPVPRHVVELHGDAWTQAEHLVTNGPFQLVSWERGRSMALSRNPDYHGRFPGNVQRVEATLTGDRSAMLNAYEAGETDVIVLLGLRPEEMGRFRRRAGEHFSRPLAFTAYVGFNAGRPPFDDARVRRAFVLATDRETLSDTVSGGDEFPATGGFIPPAMPGHSPGIGLPHDPEQARRLLAEAGYSGGAGLPAVEMYVSQNDDATARHLQAQWRETLGVEITWQSLEWTAYLAGLKEDPPHLFAMGWVSDYLDPDNFMRAGVGDCRRHTRWRSPAYDEMVERARHLQDQEERMQLYGQADRLLLEEAVLMPLSYPRGHLLAQSWVTRYATSPVAGLLWKDVVIEPH